MSILEQELIENLASNIRFEIDFLNFLAELCL